MTYMPLTASALTTTKPSQSDFDTASRVLWWLAAHARLFPGEYGEELSNSLTPVDVLVAAANACSVSLDDLITTAGEQAARDVHNRRVAAAHPLGPFPA
jgi:hypothetical protein